MTNLKKLTFAPLFWISFAYLCYLLPDFIKSLSSILSLSLSVFITITFIPIIALTTAFFFAVFVTLSQDWKLVSPVALVGALIPLLFLPSPTSFYLVIGSLIGFFAIAGILFSRLKTYLTFQPSVLLSSSIRNLATILVLTISLTFYLSVNAEIKQHGIQIPDSLIEKTLSFAPQTDVSDIQTPQIKALSQPEVQKKLIKTQFEAMIKPFENYVAPGLGLFIFLSFVSTISLAGLLTPVFLWFIFWILRSTGFVKFTTEMREVKKLVV